MLGLIAALDNPRPFSQGTTTLIYARGRVPSQDKEGPLRGTPEGHTSKRNGQLDWDNYDLLPLLAAVIRKKLRVASVVVGLVPPGLMLCVRRHMLVQFLWRGRAKRGRNAWLVSGLMAELPTSYSHQRRRPLGSCFVAVVACLCMHLPGAARTHFIYVLLLQ